MANREPTNYEQLLMRLLQFDTHEDLSAWLNAPSELPLSRQMASPEYEDDDLGVAPEASSGAE